MFGLSRCGPIRSRLWEYAEGTLGDEAARSRVERHLATCAACRALAEGYRPAAAALRDFAAVERASDPARPARWEDVRARLDATAATAAAPARRRPALVPALGVAGAALALGGAVVGVRTFTGVPERFSHESAAPVTTVEKIARESAARAAAAAAAERGPVRISADPAFLFLPPRGTYPITVQVRNAGPAVENARLRVNWSGSPERAYHYDVDLAGGATTKLTVYPSVSAWSPAGDVVDLTLTGPFPRRSALVPITTRGGYRSDRKAFGYVGDDVSAFHSRVQTEAGKSALRGIDKIAYGYAKPEDAPEKAIGYDSVDVLVLGKGAERLSRAQWLAVRRWVVGGGSLVLTAGVAPFPSTASAAAEIAPVDLATRTPHGKGVAASLPSGTYAAARVLRLTLPASNLPGERALAASDAEVLDGSRAGRWGTVVRRRVGAGTTLYVGTDPAAAAFRDVVDVPAFWSEVAALAAPTLTANDLRAAVTSDAISFRSGIPGAAAAGGDPFRVRMPRVGTVVNVFALYFVLAVPVTFVVLKRLRRMEWAWATGPALAALTAGGVALMTASLYSASLSRRTAGVLVGSPTGEARFAGFTELFFPRSGTFRVAIPAAEEYDYQSSDGHYYGPTPGPRRELSTHQVGGELTTGLPVGNLSFRRLYHTQTVRLNGGVTGRVQYLPDGGVRCEVRNDTGRTLENGFVVVPNRDYLRLRRLEPRMERFQGGLRNHDYFQVVALPRLEPGNVYRTENAALLSPSDRTPDDFGAYRPVFPAVRGVGAPVVVAQMSGREFGPDLGKAVGDDRGVIALFSLSFAGPPADLPSAAAQKGGRP